MKSSEFLKVAFFHFLGCRNSTSHSEGKPSSNILCTPTNYEAVRTASDFSLATAVICLRLALMLVSGDICSILRL
jgi:hypothetical protein